MGKSGKGSDKGSDSGSQKSGGSAKNKPISSLKEVQILEEKANEAVQK